MERPIFVFASGWRSGSTLLQRLLCSHPEIHVWGENRGLCDDLRRLHEQAIRLQPYSDPAARAFKAAPASAWIAMMNPGPDHLLAGIGALLDRALGAPARAIGKSRWGFKEVRHRLETAAFLRAVFPQSRFLLLVRDPCDCLASARATAVAPLSDGLLDEIGGPNRFLAHWVDVAASFLRADPAALPIRHEDMIAEPERSMQRIGAFLDVDPRGFDRRIFGVRRRGWLEEDPRLTAEDRAALADPDVWQVAAEYGYVPRADAPVGRETRSLC